MDDLSGQTINGYEIRKHIGTGAHGAVYNALHIEKGEEVALKALLPEHAADANIVQRFEIEAEVISRLNHPNIVTLRDHWRDDKHMFIVMRWLGGGNLRDRISVDTPMPVEQVSKMLTQIASALDAAHDASIIHRDIKPDNILFDDDNNAYISDFGVAKRLDYQSITGPDTMVGSPAYLSPEQIMKSNVTPQTDIYQLGITLYEALMGRHPFEHAPSYLQLVMCHLQEILLPMHGERPEIPEALDTVIQKATAKKPEERYRDAFSLADAFRTAAKSTG